MGTAQAVGEEEALVDASSFENFAGCMALRDTRHRLDGAERGAQRAGGRDGEAVGEV